MDIHDQLPEMRVAFDSQIFGLQPHGGISRYFSELVNTFSKRSDLGVQPFLTFTRSTNLHLETVGQHRLVLPRRVPGWMNRLRRLPTLNDQLERYVAGHRSQRSDILHATYYRPQRCDLRLASKLAVTVVDLIPETLGMHGSDNPHFGKTALIRRADLILSISEATTSRLRDFYPNLHCPIVTTPLAVDTAVFNPGEAGTAAAVVDFPYLLFVGRRGGYKNFAVVADALRIIRERGTDLGLVLVGGTPDSCESQLLNFLPSSRLLVTQAEDQELADLYRQAEAFVFPSKLEGFGLPLLEAMASGCPVIAADIDVFREVAGQAAEYFDPNDAEMLAESIRVVAGSSRRGQLVAAGVENINRFSWHATAETTAAAYRLVASNRD